MISSRTNINHHPITTKTIKGDSKNIANELQEKQTFFFQNSMIDSIVIYTNFKISKQH